jgi:hypothetical protein
LQSAALNLVDLGVSGRKYNDHGLSTVKLTKVLSARYARNGGSLSKELEEHGKQSLFKPGRRQWKKCELTPIVMFTFGRVKQSLQLQQLQNIGEKEK